MSMRYSREGQGPDLVLVHGGVGSRNHWARNIPALARHFTVTAVDLPGFGASDMPADISPDDYLDLVTDNLRSLISGPFRAAAFSFGAVVMAAVATRLPSAIERLTLIAPGGFGLPSGRKLDLRPVPPEGMASPAGHEVLRHNLGVMMFADPKTADDATVTLHRQNIEQSRFDSRRISLQERLMADLRKISCPLQLIWGDKDALAHPSIAERVALIRTVRPDVRVDLIAGAGHWAQYERPAAADRIILDFMLGAHSPAASHKTGETVP